MHLNFPQNSSLIIEFELTHSIAASPNPSVLLTISIMTLVFFASQLRPMSRKASQTKLSRHHVNIYQSNVYIVTMIRPFHDQGRGRLSRTQKILKSIGAAVMARPTPHLLHPVYLPARTVLELIQFLGQLHMFLKGTSTKPASDVVVRF